MLIPRRAEETVAKLLQGYPIVAITGPRQSGKTTLVRSMFEDRPYVSLEDPDELYFVESDPRGFLDRFPEGAVFDEAQRAPELLSYLQTHVDQDGRMGRFILTGSQNLMLMSKVTQSLAGRVALVALLPFSLGELQAGDQAPDRLEQLLFQGLYPPIHDRNLEPLTWFSNYVGTYLERDVRQVLKVRDLSDFQRFLRMCAARTGQLVNLSSLANDCGITHNTAGAWLSVLEASYIVHRLQPHHANFNKRLIKTPKLYFHDAGLAAWLLGVQKAEQILTHPQRGALFETWVIGELLKGRVNQALPSALYFWRDRGGHEVDALLEEGWTLRPVEIKSGKTLVPDFFKSLQRFKKMAGERASRPRLIYGGEESQKRSDVDVVSWRDVPRWT